MSAPRTIPITAPMPTSTMPSRMSSRTTLHGSAPIAMRIATSRSRRATA